MYNLGRNLDIQDKLRKEIRSIMKDSDQADANLLEKMPYLRACVKETLRYMPNNGVIIHAFQV